MELITKTKIANKLIEKYKDKKLIKLDYIKNSIITDIIYNDSHKGGICYNEIIDIAWEIMEIIHK